MFAAIRKTRIATSELVSARIFLFRAVRNRDPDGGEYNANERAQRRLREIIGERSELKLGKFVLAPDGFHARVSLRRPLLNKIKIIS